MSKPFSLGIIGCGDFLRWQADGLAASTTVRVRSLFDPQRARAERHAGRLGASVVESAAEILRSPEIDAVCLFVPPWARAEVLLEAAKAGKHIITTKPLGSTVAECEAMDAAARTAGVLAGVIYNRTGNALVETYRRIFAEGGIGRLALFKQDWIHHYPTWNTWALDPAKNGGPFMDAMIHNLNIARYLMGRSATACTMFSDSHAHDLTCSDTDFLKIDFTGRGSAHLFITWAADLAVHSNDGNDREHIDNTWMVTDQGWRLTHDGGVISASKDGQTRTWKVEPLAATIYDEFAAGAATRALPRTLASLAEATEDIRIIRSAQARLGVRLELGAAASPAAAAQQR